MRKTSFFLFIFSILISFSRLTPVHADSPGNLIVNTIDKSLIILKDPALQNENMLESRKQQLWEILEPIFNFNEIARRCLGRHWLDISQDQKEQFLSVFTSTLKDLYLGHSDAYQGEKIIFIREVVKDRLAKVQTNFLTTDGKKLIIDFSLLLENDDWKIYDVIIEGVSMVSTYRSQINSILDKSSFDELIKKLQSTNEEFLE